MPVVHMAGNVGTAMVVGVEGVCSFPSISKKDTVVVVVLLLLLLLLLLWLVLWLVLWLPTSGGTGKHAWVS